MYIIPSLVVIYIIWSVWNENRKRQLQKKSEENKTVEIHWLAAWLKEFEINHFVTDQGAEIRYHFDLQLKMCRGLLFVREHKENGKFIADVALPVVIQEERFPLMTSLIESFSGRIEHTRLILDKNEGTLHLRMEHNGASFRTKSTEEKTLELCKLFHLTDQVFPEFMHVLYGGGIPEAAVSKLFGVRDFEMN